MLTKNLFIFVEGQDDKRFFEKIIEPILKRRDIFTQSYPRIFS